jgi:hypothetical protein
VSDEWEVVRHYLDDVLRGAPRAFQDEANALRHGYAKLEAELVAARTLHHELRAAGATIDVVADQVWRRYEDRYRRLWRDAFSATANLDGRIRKSQVRGKAKNIDHQLDYDVAINSLLRLVFRGEPSLRAATLAEASERKLIFRNASEQAAFLKRINRLLKSPNGPSHRFQFLFDRALRDKRARDLKSQAE